MLHDIFSRAQPAVGMVLNMLPPPRPCCGGSRQVSKRREREAELADSQMLAEITGLKRKELERAGKGLQKLTALIERRRSFGFEV